MILALITFLLIVVGVPGTILFMLIMDDIFEETELAQKKREIEADKIIQKLLGTIKVTQPDLTRK